MSLEQMAYVWKLPVGATKPAGRLLLLALADIADDDGKCFPGRAYLARKCGLARNTIGIVMKRLTKAGYVTIEHRQRGDKTYSSNLYTLHVAPRACDDLGGAQHDLPTPQDGEPSYSSSTPQVKEEGQQALLVDIRSVFDHHCKAMSGDGQPMPYKLDAAIKTKIATRLKTYSVEELQRAATNLAKDDWRREKNAHPKYLYQNDTWVDEWLNKALTQEQQEDEQERLRDENTRKEMIAASIEREEEAKRNATTNADAAS